MMSYGAKPGMASVLVPDHTHWGNEGGLLARLSDGRGISGWDAQYQYLKVPPMHSPGLRSASLTPCTCHGVARYDAGMLSAVWSTLCCPPRTAPEAATGRCPACTPRSHVLVTHRASG